MDFAKVLGYISAAIGKPLSADAVEVYFDCLGDLSLDALQAGAKRVVCEHKWATFPTVAELREAAVASSQGEITALSPGEAWHLAWLAAGRIDPEIPGSFERHTKELPPLVVKAVLTFGVPALCYGTEPVGVVRGQFMKIFEQLAAREHRAALLPSALKSEIERIGQRQTPVITGEIAEVAAGIGQMPPAPTKV
jgi:hypothetical protein